MVNTRFGSHRQTVAQRERVAAACSRLLRATVRRLRTTEVSLSFAEKALRGALLVPPFTALSVLLRCADRVGHPTRVLGRTSFGAALACRLPDLIATYIWVFGVWEPDLTHFIAARLGAGDVFVDVGANIGYYSLLAARSVGLHGGVVAIEASATMFNELGRNIEADAFGHRIRRVHAAAAAKTGTLTVFAGPPHNEGMATTLPTRGLRVESIIEGVPLDQLLTLDEVSAIRIIKVDVEGGEPDVLAGMANLIAALRFDAEIVVELSPRWWPDRELQPIDVLRPFIDAGFHVYRLDNSYTAWRYLWPNQVGDAHRFRGDLTRRVSRLDVVLSRYDGDVLPINRGRSA